MTIVAGSVLTKPQVYILPIRGIVPGLLYNGPALPEQHLQTPPAIIALSLSPGPGK